MQLAIFICSDNDLGIINSIFLNSSKPILFLVEPVALFSIASLMGFEFIRE
jgi:hypothetical protein